jgi:hypothetical protein
MCFHKSNAISFSILYEALSYNRTRLVQNVAKSLLELANDAFQHLKILQINKQVVVYNKKTLTNKFFVVWFL